MGKKVQKAGSGIIVDDKISGEDEEKNLLDRVEKRMSPQKPLTPYEEAEKGEIAEQKHVAKDSSKKKGPMHLLNTDLANEDDQLAKFNDGVTHSEKDKSPETPTEVSDEWTKLIQESI